MRASSSPTTGPTVAGDELRRIDWNIYRRLHQLVVKVGAEDGRLSLVLLVDTSRSMRVGEPSTFRAAQRMTAALAAIALLRGDQAEVHALGDGRLPPARAPRRAPTDHALVRELERLPESHGTGLEAALADYARGGRRATSRCCSATPMSRRRARTGRFATLSSCGRTAGLIHMVAGDEAGYDLARTRGAAGLRERPGDRERRSTSRAPPSTPVRFARFGDAVREQLPRAASCATCACAATSTRSMCCSRMRTRSPSRSPDPPAGEQTGRGRGQEERDRERRATACAARASRP